MLDGSPSTACAPARTFNPLTASLGYMKRFKKLHPFTCLFNPPKDILMDIPFSDMLAFQMIDNVIYH